MSQKPIHILMIEDDAVDIMAFKQMVNREQLNYIYQFTNSVKNAKQLIKKHRFDIAVTDYQLRDGVFFDLFKTFIKNDIPFICVTSARDQEIAVKALKAGAYDYLIKDPARKYLSFFPLTIMKAIERKNSEAQINLLQSIVIKSNDGIVVCKAVNRILRITYANSAFYELTGYGEGSLLNQNIKMFYGEKTLEKDKQDIKKAILNNSELKKEIILHKKDKSFFWASLSLVPLKNVKTNTLQFVMMVRDVSEKKKTEAEIIAAKNIAEQAQLAEQRFLANISHEIRTPMNTIIGMSNLMYNTDLSEKQTEYLQSLKLASDNLMYLISDVLDLSKIDAGKLNFYEQQFNLFEILFELQQAFTKKLEDKDVQIIMDVDLDIANDLLGDAVRLNQILRNLLENAARFTEHGEIGVKIRLISDQDNLYKLEFQVFDTGIPMSKDEVEIIFNHFKHADQRIYRKFGGSGLGLSIVKKIIELQNGQIWVESTPNKGNTFFFNLTFKNSGTPSSIPENETNQKAQNKKLLRSLRFLVVEDNPMNQKLVTEMLGYWGSDYSTANNGLEAIKLFEQNNYDVVLMDINMPVMDGYEATRQIRNHKWAPNKNIPIIALTAAVLSGEVQQMFDVGINYYLTKPYSTKELKNIILDLVSSTKITSFDTQKINLPKEETLQESIPQPDIIEKNPLTIDLKYLRNFSGGDTGFMSEMMSMFLLQVPDEATKLLDLLRNESWKELGKLAHKMKPNFLMMGLKNQQLMALEIETLCKSDDFDTERISILTEELVDDAFQSLPLVEEAMKKL